jgi:hypothetical protein
VQHHFKSSSSHTNATKTWNPIWIQSEFGARKKEKYYLISIHTSTIEAYLEEKEGWLLRTQFFEVAGK